ncbi:hypothetical protein BDP27DRAFT_1258180 [Rhodocollybia butyracea]|uniref:Copper transporter n=1 Tax=Rhodocollybia butyracea TaxID=206335 RepID=A0A9P5UE54_9AGAR|nr:hypothetical protein BDP27DRAFT_1258180 [Rhodocollybia butyracea]
MLSGSEAPFLHWSFSNTHVLFPTLCLTSFGTFIAASCLVFAICFAERFLSFVSEEGWQPSFVSSRLQQALWKTALYWLTTFLRLLYMLCAMSFHVGLLLVITTSLATAQFLIELRRNRFLGKGYSSIQQLDETPNSTLRSRSRSKPDGIFIHPQHSNLARADAAALQLGLGGPTDRVSDNIYQLKPEVAWEAGTGRDAARALLGNSRHSTDNQINIEM